MDINKQVDAYINSLPDWQRGLCSKMRQLIHEAAPDISEEIKFTNRPYFTLNGNVCAFLAAKDHVNIFIYEGDTVDEQAFMELIKAVAENNRKGGWRKLKST